MKLQILEAKVGFLHSTIFSYCTVYSKVTAETCIMFGGVLALCCYFSQIPLTCLQFVIIGTLIHCNFYLVVMGRKKYLTLRKGRYRDGGCTSNQPGNDEYDTRMCSN